MNYQSKNLYKIFMENEKGLVMRNALSFMFKDNMLWKKWLSIYGLIFLPVVFLIFAFLTRLLSNTAFAYGGDLIAIVLAGIAFIYVILTYTGYAFVCIKSITTQQENIVLPYINFKKNWILGLKSCVGSFIYTLILGSIMIVSLLIIHCLKLYATLVAPDILGAVGVISASILILAGILILAIGLTFSMGFSWLFAQTEKINSFWQFKTILNLIKENKKRYFSAVIFNFLFFSILAIIEFVLNKYVHKTAGNAFYLLLFPYITFVGAYFTAKSIDKSKLELLK